MTIERKKDPAPMETRRYSVERFSEVPDLLRQLANELETADQDQRDGNGFGMYLNALVEAEHMGSGLGFLVVLEHDQGWTP